MREAIPIYEAYKRGDLEGLKALLGDPPPAGGGIGGITPGLAFAARLPTRAESRGVLRREYAHRRHRGALEEASQFGCYTLLGPLQGPF
jgi:hypothetical protein